MYAAHIQPVLTPHNQQQPVPSLILSMFLTEAYARLALLLDPAFDTVAVREPVHKRR